MYFVLPVGWKKTQNWLQRYQTKTRQNYSSSIGSSLVYPLKEEHWLNFSIPEGTQRLKIISNAHILQPEKIAPEDSFKYILRYQLLNKDGRPLACLCQQAKQTPQALFGSLYDIFLFYKYKFHPVIEPVGFVVCREARECG